MSAQTLHDLWLIVTVVTTLAISGVAIFLWRTFRFSSRRWFFWMLALLLASVAIEHVSAEIKNLFQPPPEDLTIAWQWLAGRVQEAVMATATLGYMIFGQNGRDSQTE